MPPLPHHRAYGSVTRRFGGLAPPSFPIEIRPRRRKRALMRARCKASEKLGRQRPLGLKMAALAGPFGDLEPTELTIASASRLPLDPGNATHAPSDPAIQRWQLAPLAEAEV